MFSLVIAVIAIALVVAVVAATSFYGGSGISESTAQAEATRLKNEEQQIMAAVDMFNADKGRWPANVQELVNTGYLTSVPQGWSMAQGGQGLQTASLAFIPAAFADAISEGWSTPVDGTPVFETRTGVPEIICAKYNLITRGDDGILKQAFTSQAGQCYGQAGDYRVVIHKGAQLVSAMNASQVLPGDIPAASAGVFWDKTPTGEVKVATDPEKVPFSKLSLDSTAAYSFTATQVGQAEVSSSRSVSNQGNSPAEGLVISAPTGFEVVGSNCGGTLAAGSSCSFSIKFLPSAAQGFSGSATVSSSNNDSVSFTVAGNGVAPSANLAITSFGLVAAGSTATKDASFTNTGVGPLTLGPVTVSGQGFNLESTNCSGTLASGAVCTSRVRLAAQGTTAHVGTLSIQTSEAGTKSANLAGQSHQSVAVLTSSPSANLADWYQSGAVTTTATYRNDGNTPLTLLNPTLSAPLSVASNTCSNIAPAGSCAITVALTRNASTGGSGSQSFVPSGAGVDASPFSVNWSIYSNIPTWSNANVSFGDVQVGETASKSVTLTNSGSVVAAWSGALALPAGLTADMSNCGNVAPNGSCTVGLTFAPTQAKDYSAANLSPSPASVIGNMLNITGKGVGAQVTPQQSGVLASNLTPWTSSGRHVMLRNTGVGPVKVTAAPVVGGNVGGYSPASGGYCGALPTLQPGQECDVYVYARGAAGSYSGTVTVPSTAGDIVVNVSGAVKGGFAAAATDFGSSQIGQAVTRSIQVSNTADYALNNLTAAVPAPYQIVAGGTCGTTLAANTSCTVNVQFTPTAAGATSGAVLTLTGNYNQITDDAESGTVGTTITQTSALTGAGTTSPAISASPSSVSKTTTSPTAGSQAVTFTNNGGTPTTLNLAWASGGSGITITPATLTCPANGSCGSATLTSGTAAATYTGTLRATPVAGGTAANVTTTFTVQSALTPADIRSAGTYVSHGSAGSTSAYTEFYFYNYGETGGSYWASWSGSAGTTSNTYGNVYCNPKSYCPTVTVTTSKTQGTYTGTLNGVSTSMTVYGPPSLSSSVSSISFGDPGTNNWGSVQRNYTVTNNGGPATSVGLTYSGKYSAWGNGCSSIAPGGSCTITVSMPAAYCAGSSYPSGPQVAESNPGSVTVSAGGSSTTISLSGTIYKSNYSSPACM